MQTRITSISFLLVTILSFQTCFASGSNNAKSSTGILDSTITWSWDPGNSSYDQIASGTWLTYTGNNNTSVLYKVYSGGSWQNANLHTYSYDNSNNRTGDLYQTWSGSAWVNSSQNVYHYNGSNLVTSSILQAWVSGAWATTDSFVYTYDGSNNLVNELDLYWSSGTWTNSQQWVYTYSGGNRASDLNQTWTGAAWSNQQKDVYTYNTNNQVTTDLTSVYPSSAAITSGELFYNYDSNNNNTSIISQVEQSNALVNQDSTHLYYHETTSGINNIVPLNASISVYPNPSKYVINVAYHSTNVSSVMATLYDVTGRPVITQTIGNGAQQIDIHQLSSGVYQMVFTDDKGAREVKRVVVE